MEVPGAASVLGEHCLFYLMIERSRKKKTTTKSQNNDNGLPLTLLQTVCRGGGKHMTSDSLLLTVTFKVSHYLLSTHHGPVEACKQQSEGEICYLLLYS